MCVSIYIYIYIYICITGDIILLLKTTIQYDEGLGAWVLGPRVLGLTYKVLVHLGPKLPT